MERKQNSGQFTTLLHELHNSETRQPSGGAGTSAGLNQLPGGKSASSLPTASSTNS